MARYHDAESGNDFDRRLFGEPLGGGSLGIGSEQGYIIEQDPEYLFGNSGGICYEADLGEANVYAFTFAYGDGDYYTGVVYAKPDYGYSTGYSQTTTDENGLTGTYTITSVQEGYASSSRAGQVFWLLYYDHEIGGTFDPTSYSPIGSNYLGTEHGYISFDPNLGPDPEMLFGSSGGTFYEADFWMAN